MVNDGAGRLCEFDSENRLILTTMGSTSSVEYDYDPFGRRVIKDHDDEGAPIVTRYVYDGPHCIVEYDGDGYWMNKYVYGSGIDEPLMMIKVEGETQTKYYYHRDALGNVMALSNAANYIVEGYTYSAFGIATVNRSDGPDDDWLTPDGVTSPISAKGNPYMFTGRRYDWETGLYYYRARYYDATLGRFISADPISYAGGINLYAYVMNNPIRFVDPMGLLVRVIYYRNGDNGTIVIIDEDTGEGHIFPAYSGNRPPGSGDPIPLGNWDILYHPDPHYFRLDAQDCNPCDDTHDPTGRYHFRIHSRGGGRSFGCIGIPSDDDWRTFLRMLVNTITQRVSDEADWLGRNITRYGTLTVIDTIPDAPYEPGPF